MISEEQINQARNDLVRFGNEWKKRKRACMEILDMICESADLNRKEFMVSLDWHNSSTSLEKGCH